MKNFNFQPLRKNEIILCSADASPRSQRNIPYEAGFFFPGAKWVGAVRNVAMHTACEFVILTTGHGMVNLNDVISPYDKHIAEYEDEVTENFHRTIPNIVGQNNYKLMIFYGGGVQRARYTKILYPILNRNNLALLTFGKPNMVDVGKIEAVVELLTDGYETSMNQIKSILSLPQRLEFYANN